MKREDLCWSTGPRVGSEGHPYCLLLAGHDGMHISHPESGYFERWSGMLCRANPETIATAWLPDDIAAAVQCAETNPPEQVSTEMVEPLVLEDLRRLVVETAGWSPVTIVQVYRPDPHPAPKRGRTLLAAVRGSLAAHRKNKEQ